MALPIARRACPIVSVLFFGCFFAFLLLYINPAVLYSSNGIDIHNYVKVMHELKASPQHITSYAGPPLRRLFILELTPEYFQQVAREPGGWTRLMVTLCIYACHYPVAGALLLTGVALFLYWIFSRYIQVTCGRRPSIVGFIPPIFLLTMCAWYEVRYCAYLLPVAGALACAVLYQRFRPAGGAARALLLSALFWLAWYMLQWGGILVLLFVLIYEFFSREHKILSVAVATAVNATLLFAVDAWILPVGMTVRWKDFTELSCLPLYVIGFFPLAAVILTAWSGLRPAQQGKAAAVGEIVRTALLACGVIAATVWICREPVNRNTRTIARTECHIINGQWQAILNEKTAVLFADFSQRPGALQAFIMHAVDHALCRTGCLGDRLFSFPQVRFFDDPLLMLEATLTNGYVNWVAVLDLCMDLGLVNTAERIAGETMENLGPYPDITYRRALVQIAKDNREAAAVYLHKLARMPFHRAEAKRLLDMLGNGNTVFSVPRIAAMRANMDTVDYFLFTVSYETVFKNLLQSNPGNKAAFDYLMTYYLLIGRLDAGAELATKASAFGYVDLPRCWEEALCVYLAANAQDPSFRAPFSSLRAETVERFNEFARTCVELANDPAVKAKLAPAFGDTYFYFSIFGRSHGASHE